MTPNYPGSATTAATDTARRAARATFHVGSACGWCGRTDVPVTQPRDYGHPPVGEKRT